MSDEAVTTPATEAVVEATETAAAAAATTTDEPAAAAVTEATTTNADQSGGGGGDDDDAAPAEEEENTTANFAPVVRLSCARASLILVVVDSNDHSSLTCCGFIVLTVSCSLTLQNT